MSDKEHDRWADELLDAALARYGSAEARPGLEERILEQLRSDARYGPKPRWGWTLAAATVMALAIAAAGLYLARRPAPPSGAPPIAALEPEVPPVVARIPEPRLPVPSHRLRQPAPRQPHSSPPQVPSAPRQERFPAPARLSEQERLLLRYARETPKGVLLTRWRVGQPIEELRIDKLSIPALVIEELKISTDENGS